MVAVAVVVVVVVIVVAAAAVVVVIMCGVRINACSFFFFLFSVPRYLTYLMYLS